MKQPENTLNKVRAISKMNPKLRILVFEPVTGNRVPHVSNKNGTFWIKEDGILYVHWGQQTYITETEMLKKLMS